MKLGIGRQLILLGGIFFLESWAKQTVRLTGGRAINQGRVEVMYAGTWRSVCGDVLWDTRDAHVICRQLGYERALATSCCSVDREVVAPAVWTRAFNCTGDESTVLECDHNISRNVSCEGFPPATVICRPAVRLVGEPTAKGGRLEVYHSGTWGTVCSEHWDIDDGTVVCRSLGYDRAVSIPSNITYSRTNNTVWLQDVRCTGNETSLFSCAHNGWENNTCNSSQDAGVKCIGRDVRLVGGESESEGRVEVLYRGVWGAVCNDSWDILDAHVTCRQLGFDRALIPNVHATSWIGSGLIWLHAVQCNGNESSLLDCAHSDWSSASDACTQRSSAGVVCKPQEHSFFARLEFVASGLDTITVTWHVTSPQLQVYALQIWINDTYDWHSTKCKETRVTGSCARKNFNATVTVIDLSPGGVYYYRLVTPSLLVSGVSKAMLTKTLEAPRNLRLVSSSFGSITVAWMSSSSGPVNYTVEIRSYGKDEWTVPHCTTNLIGEGCLVNNTTATVIGLNADKGYYFRVYAVYKSWKSHKSSSSELIRTSQPAAIWIGSLAPDCVTSEIGHVITLLCHVTGNKQVSYKWTKGERLLSNNSAVGVFKVTTSSQDDFGVYTCHVRNSEGVTSRNISVCRKTVHKQIVANGNTDSGSTSATAIITTCFVSFATFIVVLIVMKIAQIYLRRKRQSADLSRGREELAMLHYRNKPSRSGNNNEEELELNS